GVYTAMRDHHRALSRGIEDLRLVCDMYIEDLRRKMPCVRLGDYIRAVNEKNIGNTITLFQGVTVDHEFAEPTRIAEDTENGNIVRTGQFAFNKVMKAHNTKLPIALRHGPDCVVSNSYQVFEVIDKEKLLPEYLMLWLDRAETQRYAGFVSIGTTRDIFSFNDMCEVKIPIPDITIQHSIANIYTAAQKRKSLAERLNTLTKNICPILIKGSIDEATR
ncbi:MAG: restriction endonuclease subunit S, partial [Synergistaceae bacterium]|nr:restriction endonuclease subunit S [Synergistaceae bacterium]